MGLTSATTSAPQPNAPEQLAVGPVVVSLGGKRENLRHPSQKGGPRQIQATGIWAERENNEPLQNPGLNSATAYTSLIHSIWPPTHSVILRLHPLPGIALMGNCPLSYVPAKVSSVAKKNRQTVIIRQTYVVLAVLYQRHR